jgi:type II secretory pathway component GspD/PulD (secretin)
MMIRMAVTVLALTAWAGTAPAEETAVSATAGQSAVAATPEATVNLMDLPNPLNVQTFVDYVGNQLKLKFIYDPADLEVVGNIVVEPNQPVKVSQLYGLLEEVLRTKKLVMIKTKEGDWIRILPVSKAASFTRVPVPNWKVPAAGSAASAAKAAGPEEVISLSSLPNPISVQMFVEYIGARLKMKFIYDPEDLRAAGNITTVFNKPVKVSELYGLLENELREKKLVMIKTNGDWIRVLPESKVEKATNTTTTSSCAAASGISPSPGTGVPPAPK